MQREVNFVPGEWYHCFSRGVDKRVIFMEPAEYERFLMLLYVANSTTTVQVSSIGKQNQGPTLVRVLEETRGDQLVDIAAYVLIPNHYHLVLRELEPGGITSFMRRLGTGYTMYFNLKYDRTGALFSGKFKARHIANDDYFRRILSYVHGNPGELIEPAWKEGVVKDERRIRTFLQEYPYSSLPDYETGGRPEEKIISRSAVEEMVTELPNIDLVLSDVRDFGRNRDLYQGPTLEF